MQAVGAGSELVWPPGVREDPLSGGGDALVVPKDAVRLGDYVLYNPEQTEDGIRRFGSMLAVREGASAAAGRSTRGPERRPRGRPVRRPAPA